ncbi:hypothetical protein ACKKBG_A37750 [Auxenochlorella protothecoides x Auxenochlorella symbiontica]
MSSEAEPAPMMLDDSAPDEAAPGPPSPGKGPPPKHKAPSKPGNGDEPAPPPAGGGAVFVSYSERREHVSNKGGRKTGGHVYQIKFFLVDATGLEHLAAVGEDQGDAHYIYSNQPGFPGLYGHNKQDVKRWLEDVMAASQLRAGYHLDLVQDEVPTDPSSIRLPTFVAYRHERTELDDGRHAMCWFLVDVFGKEHIAISGEEKETRDGHYDYSTQGVFHVVAPLSCHNQAAVVRWLDERVVHKGQAAAAATGKLPGNFHTAGQYGRSGGVRAGRKPGSDLARAAALKKWRTAHGGAVPGADPAQEARDALAAELRAWAREEAGARSAARRRALAWASDPAPLAALAAAEEAVVLLRGGSVEDRASVQRGANGRGGAAGLAPQADGVRARVRLLALLRELAHSYAPLALAAAPGLQAALAAAPASPLASPEVAALAAWILQAWASALGCHLAVLTQERYVRDPGAELEAALGGRRAWLDAAAAAVTHRRVGQGAQEARAGREPAGGGDKGVGDGTAEGQGEDSAAAAETAAAETAAAETEPENEEGSGSEGEAMDAEEAAE